MNSKKVIVLLLALMMAAMALSGCSKTAPDTNDGSDASQEEETVKEPEEAKFYIRLNGQKVYIGQLFADVQSELGDEIKPVEEILPCGDGGGDWKRILHFYPGVYISEDQNGIICEISMSGMNDGECEALVNDQFKLGDSISELKTLLGTPPEREDEYGFTSKSGDAIIQVSSFNEGEDTIFSVSLLRGSDVGW